MTKHTIDDYRVGVRSNGTIEVVESIDLEKGLIYGITLHPQGRTATDHRDPAWSGTYFHVRWMRPYARIS